MPAPGLTFSFTRGRLSSVSGFDCISVTFRSDIAYQAFECRATKQGEPYGVGMGALVASFSATPAGVARTFEVYDDYLVNGDGAYRISLFAQGDDGSWNDNCVLVPSGAACAFASDGKLLLCGR